MAKQVNFKFEIGDNVLFLHSNKVTEGKVHMAKCFIDDDGASIHYVVNSGFVPGNQTNISQDFLHATKEDLLASL